MKLRIIGDSLNVKNAVDFLTNAILAGERELIINTEIGIIPVEIDDINTHDLNDPNFGVRVYKFNEAPFTTFVQMITRDHKESEDDYRWFLSLLYVDGQGKDLTREIVIRGLMTIFIREVLIDTKQNCRIIGNEMVDTACSIYKEVFNVDYPYQQFNRDFCNAGVPKLRRCGSNYRSLLLANREIFRMRSQLANSHHYSVVSDFRTHYGCHSKPFGGDFYADLFALIVEDTDMYFINTQPQDMYDFVTSRDYERGHSITPIGLMKICLLDRPIKKKETK